MIDSILDNDLYKASMQQFVCHHYPRLKVEYAFKCRNEGVDLTPYADEIQEEINNYCNLRLTENELTWLNDSGTVSFLSHDYTRGLRDLQLDRECVTISTEGGQFSLRIKGHWYQTILFEVPVLAIVNEVYFRNKYNYDQLIEEGRKRLKNKISWLQENADVHFNLIEFGTRRRFSGEWQKEVTTTLRDEFDGHKYINFLGTSNIKLAQELGLKAYGTMAHEYLQAFQVLAPLHKFQQVALQEWADEYRGDLGIALTDVVGMDAFLRDFHKGLANLFAGARHDSDNPYVWCDKLLAHYRSPKIGVDPRTKNAVFSDDLNFVKSLALARFYDNQIRTQFGIGTWLTNDMGMEPLKIVIKMVNSDGMPVAKLADGQGKEMCEDPVFSTHLKHVIRDLV